MKIIKKKRKLEKQENNFIAIAVLNMKIDSSGLKIVQ